MRDIKRINKVLKRIETIWLQYPDLRLGQLLLNVARDPYLYYVEDEDLAQILEDFYTPKGNA